MCFLFKNLKTFIIKVLIIYILFIQQTVSTHSIANKTGKSSFNRKNDKFYRYFNKNSDQLSNHGSELRHTAVQQSDQKLNISISVAEPYNEFTEQLQTEQSIVDEIYKNNQNSKDCQCSCDDYQKANQLINDFVLNESEDSDMDVDDTDELEKLKKPYKYIPMETIELAHQRPQRVTSTPAPPSVPHRISNLFQSATSYLSFPKFSSLEYLQLGLSLAVTGMLGVLGLSSINPYPPMFRRNSGVSNKINGQFNRFYSRKFNDTEDIISFINNLIEKFE